MSQENVDIALRGYQAFNRGDLEAASEDFDPQIEWVPLEILPEHGAIRGPAAVRRWLEMWRETFADIRFGIDEVIDAGERVIVMVVLHGTGGESGVAVHTQPFAHVWTLREGRAVRMEMLPTKGEALRAAGLSE